MNAHSDDANVVAAMMAASLNAVRTVGLVWREINDNLRVFSEPGHADGWHDIAAIEYLEEEERWVVVGRDEPRDDTSVLESRWYAMPEDTIGGWCVMTTADPPSASKGLYVADFIGGPEIAQHIADLHNAHLEEKEAEEVSTIEAAELLGVSRPTVIRMCNNGELPFRIAGIATRRISKKAVLDRIRENMPQQEDGQ